MEGIAQRHIHVSDMRSFKSCRIRWDFQSSIRKGLSPKTTPKALWKGTLVHKALEMWYGENKKRSLLKVWQDIWAAELLRLAAEQVTVDDDSLEQLFDTCEGILDQYAVWARANDNDIRVIGVEQDFIVPLLPDKGISFAGRFDQVLADENGHIWIHDFKVMGGDFFNFAAYLRDQDDQARAYSWAGRQLFGDAFRGITYTLIRSKAPTAPAILKSGKISANKSVDTTWEVFEAALKANGQTYTDEYAETRQAILDRAQRTPWTLRVQLVYSDYQLKMFELQAKHLAREMTREHVFLTPANYLVCRGCPFSTPCAALLNVGEGACNAMLDQYYTVSPYTQAALELQEYTD